MKKAKIEMNQANRNKRELIKKPEVDKTLLAKVNYFVEFELISEFKNILNVPKIDFINLIMFRLNNFLLNECLSKNIDEQKFKYLMTYMKERWEKKYDNHLQNLSIGWENFDILRKNKEKNNELEKFYFKNFVCHCSYTSEYAIHNCDKNHSIFGKYIIVYDSINNKNVIKYLICENCRKAYFIEHFLNYCEKCKINYYSCEIHDNKKTFFQATLKSPHCEPVVNEKIYCSHCKDKSALYLNPKSNVVKCLNCRFISSPHNIEWNCNICSQPFKSDVIIYNKCEVNYVKKIINYALLIKKKARPAKLPCCKNLDLKVTPFYHKKNCKGIIYFAEFHKKLIIICEKCKAVNNFGKFIWTCPQCFLRFKDIKWQENEPKLRKEIFYDKNKIISDINDEEVLRKNSYLRNIFNYQIDLNNMTITKYKKNLYDILRKREDNYPEINKTEGNNIFIPEINIRDNKELLSTEASDSKNINNINLELHSDKQLNELIKVKRNNFIQSNNINAINTEQNTKNSKEKIDDDLLTAENKKLKKRYIFEKLNRRQFVSSNNFELNNLITESNPNNNIQNENNISEPKKKYSNNLINKIKNDVIISTTSNQNSNNKRKIISKNKSNNDIRSPPLSSKLNSKLNSSNSIANGIKSEIYNSKNRSNNNNNHKEIISDSKSNHVLMHSIDHNDFSSTNKERRNLINKINSDKNKNNNSPKENKNNINIKKYLFKDSDKKVAENPRNKYININRINNNSNNINNNKNDISNKYNKNNNNINNSINNNKNNNANNIITSKRRVNRDSRQKYNENKPNLWKDINSNPKNNENKDFVSTGIVQSKYTNNKINSNINNNNNNNRNDSPYSSTSMIALKNNSKNKIPDEKPIYDNSTFRNKKKNLICKYESNKENDIDQNIPDDIVKVTSIDKMEKIPLNPAIFTNPLLANNIQQRIKHILFRGRLPIFNIDNYTIKRTLGEGTNGVIYQVMNNTNKKFYAMKKLIANNIPELDFLQKEFQICYQNPHPNVLTIYGVCVRCFDSTTFVLYVLMPLAEKDLEMEISERIRRKKYYKESELIHMIKQLVEALYYLQKERNVAHRDIKPENILIFKNHILKLADFGEAKVNNANKKKKTIRGTEFYMSPILYEGNLKSKYDIQHNPFKSDVFSLGYCFICASSLDPEVINEIRQIKDQNKIKQILKKYFPKEYSDKYINLLLKMITLDENERVDFIGLDKILQEY